MEARSLASLNLLAANPPQYPIKPTEEKQDALTLYISRVPGTRDIILSPFKPQLKNVTVEDVAASLYYIHHEDPSASFAVPRAFRDGDDWRGRSSSEDSGSKAIPRKPLPNAAHPNLSESPPNHDSRLRTSSGLAHGDQDIIVNHDRQDNEQLSHGDASSSLRQQVKEPDRSENHRPVLTPAAIQTQVPTRKPLGPRPMGVDPSPTSDESPPPLLPRPDRSQMPDLSRKPLPPFQERNGRPRSPRKRADSVNTVPFTLAVIRRDPSSGQQWNVGRISSQQTQDDQAATVLGAQTPKSHPPIEVEIETSGYAKFRGMPSTKLPGSDAAAALGALGGGSAEDSAPQRLDTNIFARQVAMTYSKSWTWNLRDKLQRVEHHFEEGTLAKRLQARAHGIRAMDANAGSRRESLGEEPAQKMRPRGYAFISPWDTRCEFRTGNGGRSLLCHHLLNDSKTTAFNPLVDEESGSATKNASSTIVSELRFNLPNSELFATEQSKEQKGLRHGNFSKLLRPMGLDTDGEEDEPASPFEMDLGKEKAGGGNRGTRVKLGKLIVANDGLKMLDLVVAANVGIWWGAWEKAS